MDVSTRRTHAREWQQVEDVLTELLYAARPELGRDGSREHAGALLGLIDGLAMAALVEPDRMPPGRAVRLLAEALDRLLTRPVP